MTWRVSDGWLIVGGGGPISLDRYPLGGGDIISIVRYPNVRPNYAFSVHVYT